MLGDDYELDEINEESALSGNLPRISKHMRQRLRDCGETDEEIDSLSPPEAAALIEYFESYPS